MYTPSVNIEYTRPDDFKYIITPNARSVYQEIVNRFLSGVHSFTIVGSYGTGKSSFLYELEKELKGSNVKDRLVVNPEVFNNCKNFDFINVVGEYAPLSNILLSKLNNGGTQNAINALDEYYKNLSKDGKFLFIFIDEFGKALEHAINNNVESESFFLQQLAEYVNAPQRNIILITTLHQNFSAYASKLSDAQRDEWSKVKGRFCDIVFHEPIEQLLFLAAKDINAKEKTICQNISKLYNVAKKSNAILNISEQDIQTLYPLDPFSAIGIATAIQIYGQNERSLFSYLQSDGTGSLNDFRKKNNRIFSLADVCDYIQYNFYTTLSQVNPDTPKWNALQIANERAQNGNIPDNIIDEALLIIKVIGMINILFPESVTLDEEVLSIYSKEALQIDNPIEVINKLKAAKIIRYANYRSRFVLFEGTDVDLEEKLYQAGTIIPKPEVTKEELEPYFRERYQLATSYYYRTGTPRYFKYVISNNVIGQDFKFDDSTDGLICLLFPKDTEDIKGILKSTKDDNRAILYVVPCKTENIRKHLWEIHKLQFVEHNIDQNDKVAVKEVRNQKEYEIKQIDKLLNTSLFNEDVEWFYKGRRRKVNSYRELNKLSSRVFTDVYNKTPIIKCEMLNKDKISTSISTARRKLLLLMLENSTQKNLGMEEDKFPAEKTIYTILLSRTGIHREVAGNVYSFNEPNNREIRNLWEECMNFLHSSEEKEKELNELVEILRKPPFRLKQGLLSFWIPIFLIIEQSQYALYSDGAYVPTLTEEVIDILLKSTNGFKIKAFAQTPVNTELFDQYRTFLRKGLTGEIGRKKFNNTYSQFFMFYRQLNPYAKHTHKFEHVETLRFRDVLANATDPEVALFNDIPGALGFRKQEEYTGADSYKDFLSHLKVSIHELVMCYDRLIDRIESAIVNALGLSKSFDEYKKELEDRYAHVKEYLLSSKSMSFYKRVMSPADSKKKFYESIGNVVLNKPLEDIADNEEDLLIDNILYYFRELDRCVEISKYDESSNNVYSVELTSSIGDNIKNNTIVLSKSKQQEVEDIESKIAELLKGHTDTGACAMLQLLGKMMKDNK